MKKTIFLIVLIISVLLILDFTYGIYQSQQSKNEFANYTQPANAIITSYQEIKSSSECKNKDRCPFVTIVEFTYDDNQGKKNTTQVNNMQLEGNKVGDKITILCHPTRWICVPKQYVETHSSPLNNMWSISLSKNRF